MAKKNISVVISDMRMPGMDGAQLLSEVRELYPGTIRIMLTGQADEDSILNTVGIVHQFLAKPYDPDKLKKLLDSLNELQELLEAEPVREAVSKLDSLPSLPAAYHKLRKTIQDPEVTIADVAAIIKQDLSMSAKVLQLVNSAFFGLVTKVKSPEHAVNLLGLNTLKSLVLSIGIFSLVKQEDVAIDMEELWQHSMIVGRLSRRLPELEGLPSNDVDECFLAGVFHDIGKLISAVIYKDSYFRLLSNHSGSGHSFCVKEKSVTGACHSEVGAYLMGLWGFSYNVIQGVGYHHRPKVKGDSSPSVSAIVSAANMFYHLREAPQSNDEDENRCLWRGQMEEYGFQISEEWYIFADKLFAEPMF